MKNSLLVLFVVMLLALVVLAYWDDAQAARRPGDPYPGATPTPEATPTSEAYPGVYLPVVENTGRRFFIPVVIEGVK